MLAELDFSRLLDRPETFFYLLKFICDLGADILEVLSKRAVLQQSLPPDLLTLCSSVMGLHLAANQLGLL